MFNLSILLGSLQFLTQCAHNFKTQKRTFGLSDIGRFGGFEKCKTKAKEYI